jgi:hypothetical protein
MKPTQIICDISHCQAQTSRERALLCNYPENAQKMDNTMDPP